MNPVARARHVLARRPWLYWSAVLVLAAVAGWSVAAAAAGVDEARRAWGATRDVVVATDDLAPGRGAGRARRRATTPGAGGGRRRRRRRCPPAPPPASTSPPARSLVERDVAASGGPQALIPHGWVARRRRRGRAGRRRRRRPRGAGQRRGRARAGRRRRRSRRRGACSWPCPPTTRRRSPRPRPPASSSLLPGRRERGVSASRWRRSRARPPRRRCGRSRTA